MRADRSRDPEAVIAALRELLHLRPDWRVGQAISNACGADPFYYEDRTLASLLNAIVEDEAEDAA